MGHRYSRCKPSVEYISLPTVDDKGINCQVPSARGSCATALKTTFHSRVLHQGTKRHCIHKIAMCPRSIWTRYLGLKGIFISCKSALLHRRLISIFKSQ